MYSHILNIEKDFWQILWLLRCAVDQGILCHSDKKEFLFSCKLCQDPRHYPFCGKCIVGDYSIVSSGDDAWYDEHSSLPREPSDLLCDFLVQQHIRRRIYQINPALIYIFI